MYWHVNNFTGFMGCTQATFPYDFLTYICFNGSILLNIIKTVKENFKIQATSVTNKRHHCLEIVRRLVNTSIASKPLKNFNIQFIHWLICQLVEQLTRIPKFWVQIQPMLAPEKEN